MHTKLEEMTEVLKLREVVPKEARIKLRTWSTLAEAWRYLDLKYGQIKRLMAEQVAYHHNFRLPKTAATIGEKFRALHGVWREVYTCLEKIKAAAHLDNPLAISLHGRRSGTCWCTPRWRRHLR